MTNKKEKKHVRPLYKGETKFQDAMKHYKIDIIKHKNEHNTYENTKLFSIWKKGNKLLDALVTERMKPGIVKNCPNI